MSNSLLKYINNRDLGSNIDSITDLDIRDYLVGQHLSNESFSRYASIKMGALGRSTEVLGVFDYNGLMTPSSSYNPNELYSVNTINPKNSVGSLYFRAMDAKCELQENIKYRAIYFDPSASDDTGDGSIIKPYKNLTASRIKPGFRHLIKAGTTITCTEDSAGSKRFLLIPNTATAEAPIIIGRYGIGLNPKLNGAGVTQVLRIGTDGKHIRIRDIEIDTVGADDANPGKLGISYNTTNANSIKNIQTSIIIARCCIHDVKRDTSLSSDCNGIKLYGAGNLILDCLIYNIATDGIWFYGYDTVICSCTIYNVAVEYQLVQRTGGDCIQCGADSSGSIVCGNYLDHSNASCKQCIYFEQTISLSDSVIICDNICLMGKKGDGIEMGQSCITCGAPNSYVLRNFCKGAGGGIVINDNIQCKNNLIIMDCARGISCGSNNTISHCTIVQISTETSQTWSVGISVDPGSRGTDIRNCLLVDMYNGIASDSTLSFSEHHNAFKIRGVSLAYIRLSGVVGSPDYSDVLNCSTSDWDLNYRPVLGSKLVNAGTSDYSWDLDINRRSDLNSTIGAYSFTEF